MTQIFNNEGKVIPITLVYSSGNYILDIKTKEKDGYSAVVISYGNKKINKIKKPILGKFLRAELERIKSSLKEIFSNENLLSLYTSILKEQDFVKREELIAQHKIDKILLYSIDFFKINDSNFENSLNKQSMKQFFEFLLAKQGEDALKAKELGVKNNHIYLPARIIREFRTEDVSKYKLGSYINVSDFKDIKLVDITGISKGRGFASVIKRWGFKGGPAAHGSKFHRRPGSIGSTTYPGRVIKGKRMPGHYGNERVTIINLELVDIIEDRNVMLIKGAIPGANGNWVIVRKAKRSS
ncbi:MAG: 50S ribosomal protein L3 [candidate division WOR-3 bacterium]|nr:50S ribosomal protein L3 [candidate division WOR-3 bacterium]MCX7947936.1 50S ribosomal protein L3 [candidate division WOR-3 bacterium]MDW8150880.1 50S ribosomal protein L3 [candidate division WOR-3 bacterium]